MGDEIDKEETFSEVVVSPVGIWTIHASSRGVTAIDYSDEMPDIQAVSSEITREAAKQLQAYFSGELHDFDIPLDIQDYSPFYKNVWNQLQKIPFGCTTSYSQIAIALDNPKAVRAVGMANGRNPIPIIIPCHRVIGKDKSLTGYAHGLAVKKWLLELEGAIAKTPTLF